MHLSGYSETEVERQILDLIFVAVVRWFTKSRWGFFLGYFAAFWIIAAFECAFGWGLDLGVEWVSCFRSKHLSRFCGCFGGSGSNVGRRMIDVCDLNAFLEGS